MTEITTEVRHKRCAAGDDRGDTEMAGTRGVSLGICLITLVTAGSLMNSTVVPDSL